MKKIAITGNIGSGKSYMSDRIRDKKRDYLKNVESESNIHVLNMDIIAKNIIPIYKNCFIGVFSADMFDSDGKINKDYISNIIFSDQRRYELMNKIVSHLVMIDVEKYLYEYVNEWDIVFIESALIFEMELNNYFEDIILIHTEENIRFERVKSRNTMDVSTIKRIMSRQIPDESKFNMCDYVIENNSDVETFDERIDYVIETILKETIW